MNAEANLSRKLGRRCRQLRHQNGLSQLDMVRGHDFSLSHYQKIERGDLDARLSTLPLCVVSRAASRGANGWSSA